jgi:beta-N-acetylhexosaminidase
LNFAPVVDLKRDPDNFIAKKERIFSPDPNIVAAHAHEFIQAHKYYNIFTTLKHFPGHGSSADDSHLGFVDVTRTWSQDELIPYQELIQRGDADFIMSGHICLQQYDPIHPATLSKAILTDLLREKLNFKGIIITDDLQMKAIRLAYDMKTAVKLAIQAGADLLLFANQDFYEEDIAPKVIQIIKELINEEEITEERIDRSFCRIKEMKLVKMTSHSPIGGH